MMHTACTELYEVTAAKAGATGQPANSTVPPLIQPQRHGP